MADSNQASQEVSLHPGQELPQNNIEPPGTWIPLPRECCFCFKIGKDCPRTPCKFFHGTEEELLAARARKENAYCPATGKTGQKAASDFARSSEPQVIHRHAKNWLQPQQKAETQMSPPPGPPPFLNEQQLVGLLPPPPPPFLSSSPGNSLHGSQLSRSNSAQLTNSTGSIHGSSHNSSLHQNQPQVISPTLPINYGYQPQAMYPPHPMIHSVPMQQAPPMMAPMYPQQMMQQNMGQPFIQPNQHISIPVPIHPMQGQQILSSPPIMHPPPLTMAMVNQGQPMMQGPHLVQNIQPNQFQGLNSFQGPPNDMQGMYLNHTQHAPPPQSMQSHLQGPPQGMQMQMPPNQFQGHNGVPMQPNPMVPHSFNPFQF